MVDSPTSYGTDTGVGGEVRGNYCTLNSVNRNNDGYVPTMSNGNLEAATAGNPTHIWGTMAVPSSTGSWYWEGVCTSMDNVRTYIGIIDPATSSASGLASYSFIDKAILNRDSHYYNLASGTAGGNSGNYTSYAQNDVVMVAYSNGKIWFGKNGTWMNSGNPAAGTGAIDTSVSTSKTWLPYFGYNSNWTANFGQRPFAYTAPSGFTALCAQNLPTPTIAKGSNYFDVLLWSGTNGNRSFTSLSMSPDFVWIKQRNQAYSVGHQIYDSVRGAGSLKQLDSSNVTVEGGGNTNLYGYLSSFDSTGFSVTAGSLDSDYVNKSGVNYVAWNWKGGSTAVTNNDGNRTASVSASTTAGFSVVTYTFSTSATNTIGHGLGVAPSMLLSRSRTTAYNWDVYHVSLGYTQRLILNNTSGASGSGWAANPTSTVFSVITGLYLNNDNIVTYCFAPIAGYSAFGSYTGNGSTDGPFVSTGFRPKWVLFKRTDSSASWYLYDTVRQNYNPMGAQTDPLIPNLSSAEGGADSSWYIDTLSNGFKIRNASNFDNASSATYIYAAFAESPFKYALAR